MTHFDKLLAEVNSRYPFDEQSENKLLRGGFTRPRDRDKLRGIRVRAYAAYLLELWEKTEDNLRSGRDTEMQQRREAEQREEELRSLQQLATEALRGGYGRDAKALAMELLGGEQNLENPKLLEGFRRGLQELRRNGQHSAAKSQGF